MLLSTFSIPSLQVQIDKHIFGEDDSFFFYLKQLQRYSVALKNDRLLDKIFSFVLFIFTLIRSGFLCNLKTKGGESLRKFIEVLWSHSFHPNSPKMTSNDIWYIKPSIKILKTIL